MTNVFKFFLLVLISVNLSCSEDDSGNQNGIVGTWLIDVLSVETSNDYDGDGVINENLLEETLCSQSDQFIFNTDGTGTLFNDGENILLTTEQDSNFMLEYTFECFDNGSSFELPFNWTQTGNEITIEIFGFPNTILTLVNNTLVGFEENGFSVPVINDDGMTWNSNMEDLTTIFVKI